MLWCDEVVGYKVPMPVPHMKAVIVVFLLVCGCHDFVDVPGDGVMVTLAPIKESIGSCGTCIEMVQATKCHDLYIVCYEFLVDAILAQGCGDP